MIGFAVILAAVLLSELKPGKKLPDAERLASGDWIRGR